MVEVYVFRETEYTDHEVICFAERGRKEAPGLGNGGPEAAGGPVGAYGSKDEK